MKTLFISGTYHNLGPRAQDQVRYNICLLGQSVLMPEIQVITYMDLTISGFNELQDICRAKYAEYFKTDLFNIVSIEHLTPC